MGAPWRSSLKSVFETLTHLATVILIFEQALFKFYTFAFKPPKLVFHASNFLYIIFRSNLLAI